MTLHKGSRLLGSRLLPRTIAARLILLVTLGTSLILAGILGFSHLRARALIEAEVASSARYLALASAHRVEAALSTTARVVEIMALQLEQQNHDAIDASALQRLLRRTLENNPEIYGTAIAFDYDGSADSPRRYAPYLYRQDAQIHAMQLEDVYDYRRQDWYQIPRELDQAGWSEPYFDADAGNTLMATYAVPFHRGSGATRHIAGIVTADIALDWLAQTIGAIKVLDTGYAFLLSRHGSILTHPVSDHIMNESIFSLAEAANDPVLRELGRRMLRGESGFVPYHGFAGMPARLYYGPIPATGWSLGIVFPEHELFADIREMTLTVAAIGLLGILLICLVVAVTARTITRPLHSLASAASRMRNGDFAVRLPAQTARDEVGDLSRAFAAMHRDLQTHIRDLVATTAAKERIEGELSIAHDIQMSILPKMLPPFFSHPAFTLFAVVEPAREVGGDFYDFFLLDDDHLCLVIADVSGKGVPASLFMAVTKTLIKATAKAALSPAEILGQVNRQITHDNDQSMFVTVFCALLDLRDGTLTYTNAGHNPPLLLPVQGAPHYLSGSPQLVIGACEDYVYQTASIQLAPGDCLLLYTDGVTEAMNLQDDLYSEERLLAVAAERQQQSVGELIKGITSSIRDFAADAPQSDDITLMAIGYRGPGKR